MWTCAGIVSFLHRYLHSFMYNRVPIPFYSVFTLIPMYYVGKSILYDFIHNVDTSRLCTFCEEFIITFCGEVEEEENGGGGGREWRRKGTEMEMT